MSLISRRICTVHSSIVLLHRSKRCIWTHWSWSSIIGRTLLRRVSHKVVSNYGQSHFRQKTLDKPLQIIWARLQLNPAFLLDPPFTTTISNSCQMRRGKFVNSVCKHFLYYQEIIKCSLWRLYRSLAFTNNQSGTVLEITRSVFSSVVKSVSVIIVFSKRLKSLYFHNFLPYEDLR